MFLLLGCGPAGAQDIVPPNEPGKLVVTTRVYDMQQLLNAPAVPEEVQRGRATWLQRCAYCHDGVGQPSYKTIGPWLGAETVQTLGEERVRAFIGAGSPRMPGFRHTLQPAQVGELVAFLKTVPSTQKPTPAQLAGRSEDVPNSGE